MKTQALEFLRELQRGGMLESMVSSVQQEAAQMPLGAMTNGAQRRLPDGPDLENDGGFSMLLLMRCLRASPVSSEGVRNGDV